MLYREYRGFNALIGFAGPRVIETDSAEKLPRLSAASFCWMAQSTAIIDRREMRDRFASLISTLHISPESELSRFQTLNQWLQWQEGLHPKKIEPRPERVASVWRKAAPGRGCHFVSLQFAGTNGKGHPVAFLEAIFRAAGLSWVGYLLTSPHLVRYKRTHTYRWQGCRRRNYLCSTERIDQARVQRL